MRYSKLVIITLVTPTLTALLDASGVGVVTAVESAPAVALRPSAAVKLSRADGSMKAPSARPAKKARQDAFDPMDPVRS